MSNRVLIFGGTGSLGKVLVGRFIKLGSTVAVFSRSEEKHVIIKNMYPGVVSFIGDIRDKDSVLRVIKNFKPQIIINAAALKNVPECEDAPEQALMTNAIGAVNLVSAIEQSGIWAKALSISTDKAAKPVNSYGMTKALQERIHLAGNGSIYNCVRYGNVLESRGSVVPFFKGRINQCLDLPITDRRMTRFLLSLDQAVDLIFLALEDNHGKKIFIPKVKSCSILTLAQSMCDYYGEPYSRIVDGSIRPGEKIDEILISEEECYRVEDAGSVYIIHDFKTNPNLSRISQEYSSANDLMTKEELTQFLYTHGVFSMKEKVKMIQSEYGVVS